MLEALHGCHTWGAPSIQRVEGRAAAPVVSMIAPCPPPPESDQRSAESASGCSGSRGLRVLVGCRWGALGQLLMER